MNDRLLSEEEIDELWEQYEKKDPNQEQDFCQLVAKAQDAKTLKAVGEYIDRESFDVKDKLPTWLIVLINNLKQGRMPE